MVKFLLALLVIWVIGCAALAVKSPECFKAPNPNSVRITDKDLNLLSF
jgi:hypothetical protein